MSVKAIYPGSFDPPTLGHMDIIERAVKIFGELTVVVAESSRKASLFSAPERRDLIEQALKAQGLENVSVVIHSGLTIDYAREHRAKLIIRGLRAVSDFEYELQMATMNRKLFPDIETFIIMTSEKFYYIASTLVKEVAIHGGDISQLVPRNVAEAVQKKLKG